MSRAQQVATPAFEVLREEIVPATVGRLPDAEVAVTGLAAGSKD